MKKVRAVRVYLGDVECCPQLGKVYEVEEENKYFYKLKGLGLFWSRKRFEEIHDLI